LSSWARKYILIKSCSPRLSDKEEGGSSEKRKPSSKGGHTSGEKKTIPLSTTGMQHNRSSLGGRGGMHMGYELRVVQKERGWGKTEKIGKRKGKNKGQPQEGGYCRCRSGICEHETFAHLIGASNPPGVACRVSEESRDRMKETLAGRRRVGSH